MSNFQVCLFIAAPFLASGIAAFVLDKLWVPQSKESSDAVPEKTARHSEQVDKAAYSGASRARMRREEYEDHLAMASTSPAKPVFTRVATPLDDAPHASANSARFNEPPEFVVPDDFSLAEFSGRHAD